MFRRLIFDVISGNFACVIQEYAYLGRETAHPKGWGSMRIFSGMALFHLMSIWKFFFVLFVLIEILLMGRNPANQLRLVVYPIIYRVLYISGGDCRISEPSTVVFVM